MSFYKWLLVLKAKFNMTKNTLFQASGWSFSPVKHRTLIVVFFHNSFFFFSLLQTSTRRHKSPKVLDKPTNLPPDLGGYENACKLQQNGYLQSPFDMKKFNSTGNVALKQAFGSYFLNCGFLLAYNVLIKYSRTHLAYQTNVGHRFHPGSSRPFITELAQPKMF